MISRRTFLAGSLVLPSIAKATISIPENGNGLVFDAVTGKTLSGIRLVFKRIGAQGRFAITTRPNGEFPYSEWFNSTVEAQLYRVKVLPGEQQYIQSQFFIYMGEKVKDTWGGRIGLIPLQSPAATAGLTNSFFNNNWMELVQKAFFSRDKDTTNLVKGVKPGALIRFPRKEVKLRFSAGIDPNTQALLEDAIRRGIGHFSGGFFEISSVSSGNIPKRNDRLPFWTIAIESSDLFPRPAVRHRYGHERSKPGNPNELIAARIILDSTTLAGFDGSMNALSETLLQRCLSAALGWQPLYGLKGISVLDQSYTSTGLDSPSFDTGYDAALGMISTGGGTGCYPAGTRFTTGKQLKLRTDKLYPINA